MRVVRGPIEQRYGRKLAARIEGEYLKTLGIHLSEAIAEGLRTTSIRARLMDERFPAIRQRAKEEDAEFHWGERTGLRRSPGHHQRLPPRILSATPFGSSPVYGSIRDDHVMDMTTDGPSVLRGPWYMGPRSGRAMHLRLHMTKRLVLLRVTRAWRRREAGERNTRGRVGGPFTERYGDAPYSTLIAW